MANELKPLSNELYEHYPLMSAQTHEAHVKAYAKAHMKEGNTRPAAPVEGLVCETCNGTGNEGRGLICRDCDEQTPPTVLVRYTLDNRPNYDHDGNPYADPVMSPKINGEYVRFDQAEAIIAAERAKLTKEEADHTRSLEERDRYHDVADKLAQAIADRYQADIGEHSNINDPWHNALNLIEADNAAKVEQERLRFEGDLDKWMKIIGAGITGYQPEAYALMDLACQEVVKLRATNAALTARVKELETDVAKREEHRGKLMKGYRGLETQLAAASKDMASVYEWLRKPDWSNRNFNIVSWANSRPMFSSFAKAYEDRERAALEDRP